MDLCVIPECFVDTNLIETLVPPEGQYNHQKGCGTVTKVMKERFQDRFALGIIDKDKNEVDYLKEFTILCSDEHLFLHKHHSRHHYIIQISPAIEQFILNCARETGLTLEDFDLPSDLEHLRKQSKTVNSKYDKRFRELFRSLIRHDHASLIKLQQWIKYLKTYTYAVDIEIIGKM